MKEISYTKPVGFGLVNLLRTRIWTEKGKVIDLVVQYESFIDGNWHIIVRYDCSHGFFHRDTLYPNGNTEKKTFETNSLEDALAFAENDIKGRHEFYRERYIKKLRK